MMDVKVNKEEWLALSDEDRKRIEQILKEAGAIGRDDKIVGDPGNIVYGKQSHRCRWPMPSCMHRSV
jgi:hypothetical protein